jgi:hypothetical protein
MEFLLFIILFSLLLHYQLQFINNHRIILFPGMYAAKTTTHSDCTQNNKQQMPKLCRYNLGSWYD